MARTIFSFILVFYTLAGFGQRRNLSIIIDVPQGNKVVLHTYAQGVQVYTCTQDPTDTTHYTWTFVAPRATLYADSTYKQPIGKHYFNTTKSPTWDNTDGSKVSAAKLQQYSPSGSNAIPWLLLKASATGGAGVLTPVTYIQRIGTTGGKAPATATSAQKGQTIEVRYTAEYLFWGKE
jgi:Protein of unknown function (DUF3455)